MYFSYPSNYRGNKSIKSCENNRDFENFPSLLINFMCNAIVLFVNFYSLEKTKMYCNLKLITTLWSNFEVFPNMLIKVEVFTPQLTTITGELRFMCVCIFSD